MQIRNVNTLVTENFTEAELYSNAPDAPDAHFLDDNVIEALQYIRDLSGKPIRVTSTYRTPTYNTLIGGSSTSQHLVGRAIDFHWLQDNDVELQRFKAEFLKTDSQLRQNLFDMGVRGIGFYETFLHIDTRPTDEWSTWGDDNSMIAQDGYTAYVYDVSLGFFRDYRNYIALAVLALSVYLLIRTI